MEPQYEIIIPFFTTIGLVSLIVFFSGIGKKGFEANWLQSKKSLFLENVERHLKNFEVQSEHPEQKINSEWFAILNAEALAIEADVGATWLRFKNDLHGVKPVIMLVLIGYQKSHYLNTTHGVY